MKAITETFLETDWEDEAEARQARDDRAAELTAQGFVCICQDLWNVADRRVFLVEATQPEIEDSRFDSSKSRPGAKAKPVKRTLADFETL
jgi:hypothetical protein